MVKTRLVVAGAFLCGMLQEEVDNPTYIHGSKFKPGTWVILRTTTTSSGRTTEHDVTTKLAAIDDPQATVESTDSRFANKPETRNHQAKIKKVPNFESAVTTPVWKDSASRGLTRRSLPPGRAKSGTETRPANSTFCSGITFVPKDAKERRAIKSSR